MCFKNLPIEFDEQGKPYLREGVRDPYGYSTKPSEESPLDSPKKGNPDGEIREINIDPVTRVAGALAFHSVVDMKERKVTEAHSSATLFRGYELILKGRDPRDAIDISSRACGVCGGVHSTCASMALEMAFPVEPPPMAIVVRNLGETAEMLYDHPLHLFLLAGPDYSEAVVKSTNPEIWEKAEKAETSHKDIHGFSTIGEIMQALNPLTGKLYLEALQITRLSREACSLMYGKYPHPSTLVPGGVSTNLSRQTFTDYYTRLVKLFDYSKRVVAIWDDVFDFFYAANPEYKKVGQRPINMIGTGIWDDPDAYDATYANANTWGEKRFATPGVIINGELRTTQLVNINLGLEEFVEHSYYEDWTDGKRFDTDPLGGPLSPHHPWNKQTKPLPTGRNWREKYTWATSPRWDRTVMEAGVYARMWITALAQKVQNDFIKPTGTSMKLSVPKGELPEMELEWKIPDTLNAIERNRARAYAMPYTCLVAFINLLKAFDLLKEGKTKQWQKYKVPTRGTQIGVGFWEAGRGYLTHHLVLEREKIANYQILTPSTWNASPRDPAGNPGPYEEAVLNTPILEASLGDDFKGIDILRTIRSFDPCMPCTVHLYAGDKVIVRDANSCACTLED